MARALIVAMFAVAIWICRRRSRLHWNHAGQTTAMGRSSSACFCGDYCAVLLSARRIDPEIYPREYDRQSITALSWFRLAFVLLIAGKFGVIVAAVCGTNLNIHRVVVFLFALMMVAAANLWVRRIRAKTGKTAPAKWRNPNLMAQLFRQMTVCGVGLIGGSLAHIARRAGVVGKVVGLGRSQANLDVALDRGHDRYSDAGPGRGGARCRPHRAGRAQILTMRATLEQMIEHTAPTQS